MFPTEKVKLILLEEFLTIQARNPRYSMRSYAKKIGISQPAVSEMLSGKRAITKKTAEKILLGLDKSPFEISEIMKSEPENKDTFKSLDMETYHLIADWHYYGILSLAETDNFQSSPAWISKRLGISERIATEAIERLLKLDLLERDPKTKKLKPTHEQLEALSEVAKPALKKACRQNIELASAALDETEFIERDFTAITLCFDPDRMAEAKKMIKNFRRNFSKVMESKKKKEVYKLTIQLFPLTKRGVK